MPVLDFKEIPQANVAGGKQDTFELFARDFLEMMGFKVTEGPDRGQDGGRDLIVVEYRNGIIGMTEFKWLVSCKHKAHSGQAVVDSDETDITDRAKANGAIGFIGFYSTIVSSPLARKIKGLEIPNMIFDHEKIEQIMLESQSGKSIAARYFPVSYKQWEMGHHQPANLLDEYEPLLCHKCGQDLLANRSGILGFVTELKEDYKKRYVDVYWACRGDCDRILEKVYFKKYGFITGWQDIEDLLIPGKFVEWNIAHLNRMRENHDIWDDEAFEKLKDFIIKLSQLVVRNQTEEQRERWRRLSSMPSL